MASVRASQSVLPPRASRGRQLPPGGTRETEAAAQAEVAAFGPTAIAVAGDVSKRADVEAMVAPCGQVRPPRHRRQQRWHRDQKALPRSDRRRVERVINVNLFGSFLVSQVAAAPDGQAGAGRQTDQISSVHEDIPFPEYTAYCASKGGIRMMMRNLAMELAPYKINVNNIAPGAIATPINQKVLDDPIASKNAISEMPWGRFGTPGRGRVASRVFLAATDSDYVTGSTYYVDGGLTQQVTLYLVGLGSGSRDAAALWAGPVAEVAWASRP